LVFRHTSKFDGKHQRFWYHICIFANSRAKQKKYKRATKPTQGQKDNAAKMKEILTRKTKQRNANRVGG
jgi:hypothetical protein